MRIPAVIAFDPGDVTGWCYFKNGKPETFGQFNEGSTDPLLQQIALDPTFKDLGASGDIVFVVEDYKIFGHRAKQQTGSRVVAAQVIGAIKMIATIVGAKVELQPANILPIAEKMAQAKMPSNHSESHQVSAYLHGYYWLVKHGHILTKLQEEMQNAAKD